MGRVDASAGSVASVAGSPGLAVRLRAARPGLRPAEQRVADVLLAAPERAASMTVVELAALAGTSTATVIRLANQLGYSRIKELRLDLVRDETSARAQYADVFAAMGDISPADSLAEVVDKIAANETRSIADTAAALDVGALRRAVELVAAARRVDSFGVGASAFVGLDLQQKLTRIGRTALHWPDPNGAWTSAATLDARCVAIGVSHGGTTADVVEFVRIARAAGAATIVITNAVASPLADAGDVVIVTTAHESPLRSGAFGSRIAQLMVIDCLFSGVVQASFDDSVAALRATYGVVARRR